MKEEEIEKGDCGPPTPKVFFFGFCWIWTKRYLITSQTRVNRVHLRSETWTQWTIQAARVKVHHQPYSFEDGPGVYSANAVHSLLRGDSVPLGSNPTKSKKKKTKLWRSITKSWAKAKDSDAGSVDLIFCFHSAKTVFCQWRLVKKLNSTNWGAFFRHFWASKVISTTHEHKNGVLFLFYRRLFKQNLRSYDQRWPK